VAFRIDFPRFLQGLSERDRQLAHYLSLGHPARLAAREFRLSPGRIIQVRVQWCRAWYTMHGEKAPFEVRQACGEKYNTESPSLTPARGAP
jgi:hypothetical protein